MNCCIITVGTELLMGNTVNTNAAYLSERLNALGINVLYHVTTGDNPNRLKEAFDYYREKVDLIITTGGLGPTQDDLTKEVISEALGLKMQVHQGSLDNLHEIFKKFNREMTENNYKQAYIPEGGTALKNARGTAPGVFVEKNGIKVVMLPGPPREIKPMFENQVIGLLQEWEQQTITSKYIRSFGIGESSLETLLQDMIDNQTNPTIATYAKTGEVAIRVTAGGRSEDENLALLQPTLIEIKERLGDKIYSEEDEELKQVVGKLLIDHAVTISTGESCTGGLLSAALTDVPGISSVFMGGNIVYSNEAKINQLGVKPATLDSYGAVSHETAKEMAAGLCNKYKTDIGIAITGIAGPDGGTELKPVGLVYIGVCYKGDVLSHGFKFSGDREKIRLYTVLNALDLIRKLLIE